MGAITLANWASTVLARPGLPGSALPDGADRRTFRKGRHLRSLPGRVQSRERASAAIPRRSGLAFSATRHGARLVGPCINTNDRVRNASAAARPGANLAEP